MTRQIFVIGLIAVFVFSTPQAGAADELVPPFGFRWNDLMPRVEAVLHKAKAKVVSREKKENRESWTVEGLIHPGLKRTVFTFKERELVAVELQYEYPDWGIEQYNRRMGEIRKYFDEKYGIGNLCHVPAPTTPTSFKHWSVTNGRCLSLMDQARQC